MADSIRVADLDAMNPAEREAALGRLVDQAMTPGNGQLAVATARVRSYEQQYEMTSAELVERLAKGLQKETAEIAKWLFWLSVLKPSAR